MDLGLTFGVLGAIAAAIGIVTATARFGRGVVDRLKGKRPAEPTTAEHQEETNRLLREIRDGLARPPEGAADIGTEELAKAAGADTATRLREALELRAQHKEREAIDCLYEAFRRDLEPDAKVQLHILLGNSFFRLSLWKESESHYRQALGVSRAANLRRDEGVALGNLGVVYAHEGEREKSEQHIQKALAIHQEIGNRKGEAIQLANLGNVYTEQAS